MNTTVQLHLHLQHHHHRLHVHFSFLDYRLQSPMLYIHLGLLQIHTFQLIKTKETRLRNSICIRYSGYANIYIFAYVKWQTTTLGIECARKFIVSHKLNAACICTHATDLQWRYTGLYTQNSICRVHTLYSKRIYQNSFSSICRKSHQHDKIWNYP